MKIFLSVAFTLTSLLCIGLATEDTEKIYPPFVNQLGYNHGESKRFVCYGAADGTPFQILNQTTGEVVFTGELLNFEGWFTGFEPNSTDEFVVQVDDHGTSVPFWIADHLMEKVSAKLAYDFFVDVRGFEDLSSYDPSQVYGGGPSRDSGGYGLETIFEVLFYASNPALFDNWTKELGNTRVADLIDLILWHAEFAYQYIHYNGPVKQRHGSLGYEGQPRMSYDYWNLLDHLAAVCGAYHSFLKPYLDEETYQKYRSACLENWEAYERHKVVRYWTYSTKWVDRGFQEFNEMGNAFGQSIFSNLFMYLCERAEGSGQAGPFLRWAQESAEDIIRNWDFNNPRHMWWIRNAEHITPQALAFFLLAAPQEAPAGTREKLAAWAIHMKQKTNNYWKYRVHSETEWAHPETKELGGAPALGGSMFAVAHLLNDPRLRDIGWAQVDFVFGVNPVGAHLSNKSDERVEIGGFWEGVEVGWPQAHPDGYGQLGLVRGTLDGSPLDSQFPIAPFVEKIIGSNEGKDFGRNAYATEGWSVSNRGWMSTLTFSTLGSHSIRFMDAQGADIENARMEETVSIELQAALNLDWEAIDAGWVDIRVGKETVDRLEVRETANNSGLFVGEYRIPRGTDTDRLTVSYGYLGFEKTDVLTINTAP